MAYKIYPEIGMVVNSQCKNPTPSWNGKVLGLQVICLKNSHSIEFVACRFGRMAF
jgi:hypothetical protein